MATPRVTEPTPAEAAALSAFLEARLYAYNQQRTGFCDGRDFQATVVDSAGAVVGAISGHTWGGCCHVVALWVHEAWRHQGLGTQLLQAVEAEAVARGCGQVLLYTHSFQAPRFYEARGYVRVAQVDGYPRGHAQLGYVKALAPAA